LVLDTCIRAIETEASFKNADTDDEYHPYKQYKKIYPNWQISTESPKTGPKYWEWFIATCITELIEWIKTEPTTVDEQGWQDITEEEAIDNLSETYGLSVEPD